MTAPCGAGEKHCLHYVTYACHWDTRAGTTYEIEQQHCLLLAAALTNAGKTWQLEVREVHQEQARTQSCPKTAQPIATQCGCTKVTLFGHESLKQSAMHLLLHCCPKLTGFHQCLILNKLPRQHMHSLMHCSKLRANRGATTCGENGCCHTYHAASVQCSKNQELIQALPCPGTPQ
jgi:hypothetical protein